MKKIISLLILISLFVFSGCSIKNVKNFDLSPDEKSEYGIVNVKLEYPNILYYTGTPQIGNSDYLTGSWRYASGGTGIRELIELKDPPVSGIKQGFHITGSSESQACTDVGVDAVPLTYGETYILSCYAKGIGQLHLEHGTNPWKSKVLDVTDKWQQYSYMFTVGDGDGNSPESSLDNIFIGVNRGTDSDITICGMKIELVHPSNWTQNPSDKA